MNFEMVFSGPCAYVPNRLTDDDPSLGPPASWSVILPQIRLGRKVTGVVLEPHYALLQFPLDQFVTESVDLRFQKRGGPEYGVIFLNGHKVRIQVENPQPFQPALSELPQAVLESGRPETREQEESLHWLPLLDQILPGAGAFGNDQELLFLAPENAPGGPSELRFAEAVPQEGNIAAHVLLEHGRLVTRSLVPDLDPPTDDRNIWEFRTSTGELKAKQAVAYKVALRIDPLEGPLAIHLTNGSESRVVRLRENLAADQVAVELKNREMDEVIQIAEGEIEIEDTDHDFKVLYMLSGKQGEDCPLPRLAQAGGVGTRRTTCGGTRFSGFANFF